MSFSVAAADRFERTVADGLGSADTGGAYTLHAASTRYQVGSGVASITTPADSSSHATLAGAVGLSCEGIVKMVLPNSSNNDAYGGIIFRGNDAGNFFYAAAAFFDASGINIVWFYTNGNYAAGPVFVDLVNPQDPSATLWLRAQCVPEGTVTRLRSRVWIDGEEEPVTWDINATEGTNGPQTSGRIGLYNATLLDQFTITYDEFTVLVDQFVYQPFNPGPM